MKNVLFSSLWKSLPIESLHKAFWFWGIRFLLHAATVLGITLILSLFIAHYHAAKLPLLFLGIAIGSIIGTALIQFLVRKYKSLQVLKGVSFLLPFFLLLVFL